MKSTTGHDWTDAEILAIKAIDYIDDVLLHPIENEHAVSALHLGSMILSSADTSH